MSKAVDYGDPPPDVTDDAGDDDAGYGVDDFLTDRQLKHGNGSGPAAVDTHARRTPAVALQQSSAAVSSSTNTHARTRPPSDVSAQRQRTDVSGSRGVNHSQTTTGDRTHAHDRDVASHGHQHGQAPVASQGARPMAFDWGGFEQVASLQATNQRLLTELDAARQELADARRDADGGASDAMPIGAAAASARVSALSKRNRELTASLGAERGRLKTAQKEMADMRAEMRDLETRLTRATAAEARLAHKLELATAAAASTPALATPTPTPSVRHTATPGTAAHDGSRRQSGDSAAVESSESSSGTEASAKLKDYRRECGELRRELQRAMAALAKEVGADVQVARVLAGEPGWRGRAEQINGLKAELAKARAEVANGGSGGSATRRGDRLSSSVVEERNAQHLRQLELQRKRDLEVAASERDAAVEEVTSLKYKVTGLNARNRALTRELKAAKERISAVESELVVEQGKVAELLQVARDSGTFRPQSSSSHNSGYSHHPDSHGKASDGNERELRELRDRCRAQDATIAHLEDRLASALQRARQGRPLSGSPLPARVITPAHPTAAGGLGSGGSELDGTSTAELYMQIEELKGLRRAESLQVAQLRELCENRQARIADLEDKLNAARADARADKAAVARLRSELASTAGGGDTAPLRARRELEERLAVQTDENAALRSTMRDALAAKEEEITLLHSLLDGTKRVFSDGLRSYKNRFAQAS